MTLRFQQLGLAFSADPPLGPWHAHSALQPTPLVLEDGRIRVFCGMRDDDGRGSVGWVDIDERDPTRVIGTSSVPALVRGAAGTFDQDGVVPCAVLRVGGEVRLYYAGYRRHDGAARFEAWTGLATSHDDGLTFQRDEAAAGQVLFPTEGATQFRAIHSIMPLEGGGFRAWYGAGNGFRQGATKSLPVYDIHVFDSDDGRSFPDTGELCMPISGDEYRVGRPYVVHHADRWHMFFCAGSEATVYRMAYAHSTDGRTWTRDDSCLAGLDVTPDGPATTMLAYPALVVGTAGSFLLFNGDDYGHAGFCAAQLLDGCDSGLPPMSSVS